MQFLIFPILAGLVAQLIKIFSDPKRGISVTNLFSYSGMPSSHSAIMISLSTIAYLKEGFNSPIFAISLIMAFIIIRDALGIRRYLGQHGHFLNALVKDLDEDKFLDKEYPHLLEKIGHTPAQVIVGSFIGAIVSLVGWYFI